VGASFDDVLSVSTSGSWTVKACSNGNCTSNQVLASAPFTVQPVNVAPVANNDSYATNEDTPLNIAAPGILGNDTDVDSPTLTVATPRPVSGPAHGSLAINGDGSFTYTPAANFNGSDSFTYRATDGSLQSNVATVSITVNPVNDAPVANNDSSSTNEDTPLTVAAPGVLGNDTDVDGPTLTASLVGGSAHGTLALNSNGSFTYTPAADFNGTDTFTYKASDGSLDSNVATVTITINAVNDAPVAVNDAKTTNEDTGFAFDVVANDTDVDHANGDLHVVPGSISTHNIFAVSLDADGRTLHVSLPANKNSGSTPAGFSVDYQVSDGALTSNTATLTITVNPVNDAPVAVSDGYATDEDTPLTVPTASGVRANDSDVETPQANLSVSLVAGPAHGTLAITADGSFTYTPAADFNGSDSFTYKVTDRGDPDSCAGSPPACTAALDSNVAVVSITVNPVNDAPVISSVSTSLSAISEGSSTTLTVTFADVEADGHTCHLTWGDGSTQNVAATTATTCVVSHLYADDPAGTPDTVTISVTVEDDAGVDGGAHQTSSAMTASITVNNVAPTVDSVTISNGSGTSCLAGNAADVSFTFHDPGVLDASWVADIDWGDGSPHGFVTLGSQSGTFGPYDHPYSAGTYTPNLTITDKDGSSGSRTATTGAVSFVYATSGILQPINLTGQRSSFKLGSTIPLKIRVTDCAGTPVSGLVLTVKLQKLDNSGTPVNETVVDGVPDVGNTMRFSGSPDNQYIYNLSTKRSQLASPPGGDLTAGSYRVTVSNPSIATATADFDTK
jgi:VCBS repeat-containing protein